MSARFDIFGIDGGVAITAAGLMDRYHQIGYPRNPFREQGGAEPDESAPFYTGHLVDQLRTIQQWIEDVHEKQIRKPLSLVGQIGTGKTRILTRVEHALSGWPPAERVVAKRIRLSDTGYSRASIGGLLIAALEEVSIPGAESPPGGVLPLVWAVLTVASPLAGSGDRLSASLRRVRDWPPSDREEGARLITKWLQRAQLNATQGSRVGLQRRLDWEGELIPVLAGLLRLAQDAGVLRTFFLLIDQLEDLFRDTFSELRRSRLLTDLRGLVDEISDGTPIGLLLAWTPDFGVGAGTWPAGGVERAFQDKYHALYSRLADRRVNLPSLSYEHATPFAREWVDALKDQPYFEPERQPPLEELVTAAWARLFPRSTAQASILSRRATPRELLNALANEVDERAEEA